MHSAKRRKLNQSHSSFNKPFRSPLHATAKPHAQTHASKGEPIDLHKDSAAENHLPLSMNHTAPGKLLQKSRKPPSNVYTSLVAEDSEDLQRLHTSLSIRLTCLRQSLEIAEQALQIESSSQGMELKKLITKWRTVAQEAADELFVDAKDRIDGMGGVTAWRRRAEEDSQRWCDDEEEEKKQAQKSAIASDDLQSQNKLRMTDRQELSEPEEDEESSFSMAMMLHQMNIDPEAIGFDKQLEQWVE